jgi:hypothetical protein
VLCSEPTPPKSPTLHSYGDGAAAKAETPLRRVADPRPTAPFAHHSERELARLLDFYRIRWMYEPRSFVLEYDGRGRMRESFTPDFYLPEYDLYIELTTIKPELATRKNRKLRKMRDRYPEVKVKLLTLRDFRHLMEKYGLGEAAE